MKKIFLLIALAILSVTTLSALAPAKVAIINTGGGAVNIEIKLANYVTGTANVLYTQPVASYTPNGSGLILANLSGAGWTAITPASVTSYYILDVYIGGTLSAQYRLDQLLLAQGQGGVFDNNGNLTPSTDNSADLGSTTNQWKDIYVKGNVVIDGKGISVSGASSAISFGKTVDAHQNFETAYGVNAAQNNTNNQVTAFGFGTAHSNTADNLTAMGYLTAQSNSGSTVTAMGIQAGYNNSGQRLTAIGGLTAQGNTGDDVTALGFQAALNNTGSNVVAIGRDAGNGNTKSAVTILANTSLPSFADRATAVASLSVGAIAGNTYLYYNQATFAIEGYRP